MADTRVHGYARVSTKEQNEARQIKALKEQGIADRDIYVDKISGKSFERPEYKRLLNVGRVDGIDVCGLFFIVSVRGNMSMGFSVIFEKAPFAGTYQ